MKIPFSFLERILEVPALRLEAFQGLLAKNGELPDREGLVATLIYAHVLKYAPPEIAALLTTKVMGKHGRGVTAIAVINKSGLVANGVDLWDLATTKELDATKLAGIYEQHGLDLEEYTRLLEEAFSDAEAKRAQRHRVGAPGASESLPASGAPAERPVSPGGPGSASPQQ